MPHDAASAFDLPDSRHPGDAGGAGGAGGSGEPGAAGAPGDPGGATWYPGADALGGRRAVATATAADELDRVEQLLVQFEELENQLQQVREGLMHSHRLATLGTIATVIAHEFNNILTPIISYAQLALGRKDDVELMLKAVQKALSGAERAAQISSSLLGFAREADQEHAASLSQAVSDAVSCLARDPKRDGIELTIDVPDVRVAMSSVNIQQVLVNLLLNARQAMRRTGGSIRIQAQVRGGLVHIDVADSGPGISDKVRDRLFEPFVTHRPDASGNGDGDANGNGDGWDGGRGSGSGNGDGAGGERKGTGLGLCICRDLVRSAGGSISVDSTPGQGATFRIVVPRADDLFEST